MSEQILSETARRGADAKQLLESPLLAESFAALRRAYTRSFASLERTYTAKRHGLDADTMRGAWPRR